ncbi:MAG: putative metal-binding motif-containing protein [Myxococcales bacterium]|nr:putative metal-binding motif-containing protein [Myxococcales bacterium]
MKAASFVAALAVMGSIGCGGGNVQDADGDGQLAIADGGVDCNDLNAEVWTGAAEVCDDGIDNNCDGRIDDVGLGSVLWYQDFDGDGFGIESEQREACAGALAGLGWAALLGDCDDGDAALNPAAPDDECDRIDQDCDGTADDGSELKAWYADDDGDGFGDADVSVLDCAPPIAHVADHTDCDDASVDAFPGGVEVACTGIDEDCDGEVDEDSPLSTFYLDNDGDGLGNAKAPVQAACAPPAGAVANAGDCHDDDPSVTDVCEPTVSIAGTPYNTLPDALAAAQDGDVIDLTPGVHSVSSTVLIPNTGNFGIGGELTLRGTPHGEVILQNTGSGEVFEIPLVTAVLEHLVFLGPNPAIYQSGLGTLVIRDTRFEGQRSDRRGGAIRQQNGVLTLERVRFEDTQSDERGGAIALGLSEAIFSTATFTDVAFVDTSAGWEGGAVSLVNTGLVCTRCSFEDTVAQGDGGALHAQFRRFTMLDSRFVRTQGANGGALAVLDHTDVTMRGNHFQQNVATGVGGGVFVQGDAVELSNNAFCHGESDSGTAMELLEGTFEVANNSVVGAAAGGLGLVVALPTADVHFVNNVFASAPTEALFFLQGGIAPSIDYNAFHDTDGAVTGASLGVGNLEGLDPQLVAWSDDGDCGDDDLRPGFGSPLVDAGDPTRLDPDSGVSDIGFTGGPDATAQLDDDGDGVPAYLDCNDGSAVANPGAVEICNGADDDCDGVIDNGLGTFTYYIDADGDGVGGDVAVEMCFESARTGFSDATGDCNDLQADIHPAAKELCNQLDDDCDGQLDDLDPDVVGALPLYEDFDGDGFGGCPTPDCLPLQICEPDIEFFHVAQGGDCDDANRHVHPGRDEVEANGLDDDCNGADVGSDGTEIPVVSAGCGCVSEGGAALGWWLGLPIAALLRRRRSA